MVPELATCGATSAASPACLTVMVPWFSILAFGLRRLVEHHAAGHEVLVGDAGGADHQRRRR